MPVDKSWIGTTGIDGGIVRLIPRMKEWVNAYYPGLEIGLTEYNWGAENHINGATAQADIYGIFGREGVALATFWPLAADNSMVYAAIRAYRSYDGADGHFGDTSIMAESSDIARATVYASIDDADAWTARALGAGATEVFPVADQPYGLRQGRVQDPWGHHWLIGAPLESSAPLGS